MSRDRRNKENFCSYRSKIRREKTGAVWFYARGEQKSESDIDFLIERGQIQGWEFFGFINNLEDDLGVHIDVFTYDSLKDSLIAGALRNEVVLYEQ